jgi:hypothetical protein
MTPGGPGAPELPTRPLASGSVPGLIKLILSYCLSPPAGHVAQPGPSLWSRWEFYRPNYTGLQCLRSRCSLAPPGSHLYAWRLPEGKAPGAELGAALFTLGSVDTKARHGPIPRPLYLNTLQIFAHSSNTTSAGKPSLITGPRRGPW